MPGAEPDLLIGRKFGNYELVSLLGRGGMGGVYLARHPTLGKQVAIKVLHKELASDRGAIGRLIDEARASTAIGSDHIVEIFDCGETSDGITYLVMEALEGQTLEQRLERRGRLDAREAIAIAREVCAALDAAHRRGIIHRDLKPQNIFLSRTGDGAERVKILDFGVAKLLDAAVRAGPVTATGAVLGTPFYMAPEQARGEKVDGRADLFALGVILYRALTGTLPFTGETLTEVLANLLTAELPSLSARAPEAGIPPRLESAVLRALSREPAGRQPDLAAFEHELAGCLAGLPAAARDLELAETMATPPGALTLPPAPPAHLPASPAPSASSATPARAPIATTLGASATVDTAVSTVESRVSRKMLWLRLVLYPVLTGIFVLGYAILLRRGIAQAGVLPELIAVAIGAPLAAYLVELGYLVVRRRGASTRPLHLGLIAAFILVATYALHMNGTLTNYMVMFYAMLIIFTRVRLDNRAALFATVLSIASFVGVALSEHLGALRYARMLSPNAAPSLPRDPAYVAVILCGAVAFLVLAHIAAHILVRNLEAREEALASLSRGLEGQVAEKIEVLGRRELLRRFLPAPLVEEVVAGRNPAEPATARQKISVVRCSLPGYYEETASLEPEEQARILSELHTEIAGTASRFGAVCEGLRDGSATLLVGPPRGLEGAEQAGTALRVGLALLHALASRLPAWRAMGAARLSARVAVHTGYATVGNFGSAEQLQYTAVGGALAVCDAALVAGPENALVATQATRALAGERFRFEACGDFAPPGSAERVALFKVVG
jgi:serine/threonine-protein kinase